MVLYVKVSGALEAGKRLPLLDIGAGVYPTTLFFNHACAPNTVRINQGTRVVFFAKRNIRKGEEVTECYGIHHLSMNKKERQEALLKGYRSVIIRIFSWKSNEQLLLLCHRFECACAGCNEDMPLMAEMPGQITPKVAIKLGTPLSK